MENPINAIHSFYEELCASVSLPGRLRSLLRNLSPNDLCVLKTLSPSLVLVAAARGSPASLILLSAEFGFDWNTHIGDTGNVLLWSVRHSNVANVELLLSYDDNEVDLLCRTTKTRRTALHIAAETGNMEVLEMLLSNSQFDVNQRDGDGNTALHHAIRAHHNQAVTKLVDRRADVSSINNQARLPVFDAIDVCDIDMIKLLLPLGEFSSYFTPCQYAASTPILSDAMSLRVLQCIVEERGSLGDAVTGTGLDLYHIALKRNKPLCAAFIETLARPRDQPLPFR